MVPRGLDDPVDFLRSSHPIQCRIQVGLERLPLRKIYGKRVAAAKSGSTDSDAKATRQARRSQPEAAFMRGEDRLL